MVSGATTATHFWPVSFAERGVAVPFTTPSISMARVRNGERGKLELVISGLSGGRGVYVIGWKGVPETFRLTVYDRVLHDRISEIETVTPEAVHDAVVRAAVTGLAGEAAAEAAHENSTRGTENQLRISLALTQHVLKTVVDVDLDIGIAELTTREGQVKIQNLLGRIARMENIEPETLSTVMTEWGDLLTPFGVPGFRPRGRYRRVLENADEFLSSFDDWARTSGIDADDSCHLITDVLQETLANWRLAFNELDSYAANPRLTIKKWQDSKAALLKVAKRMPWLEDGWPMIFANWDNALRGSEDQRRAAIGQVLGILPLLPRDEVSKSSHGLWMDYAKRLSLTNADNEERRQGDIDLEAMLRQETLLARTLE